MDNTAVNLVRSLQEDTQLISFTHRLAARLTAEGGLTDSRAKALLRAADTLDEPTLHSFNRLVEQPSAVRLALCDLLSATGLAEDPEIAALPQLPISTPQSPISWLPLTIAAYAWKNGYPLQQLDPAAPPDPNSPAGQLLKRAAQFMRQQVQRSATEKDKLGRKLSQPPTNAPSLEQLPTATPIPPLPPIFRPPIPVRYHEVSRETLTVTPETPPPPAPPPAAPTTPPGVTRGEPLKITRDDLAPAASPTPPPITNPPITISHDQIAPQRPSQQRPPRPLPRSAVVMPNSAVESRPGLSVAVRQMLGQEALKTTKLRVKVQQHPDGPGLYGLQIRVTCPGIKSYVAGTTDRDGTFLCELPVRLTTGLTYDVDVTWPRDEGGDTERKSITLNADRTEFILPFYRKLKP